MRLQGAQDSAETCWPCSCRGTAAQDWGRGPAVRLGEQGLTVGLLGALAYGHLGLGWGPVWGCEWVDPSWVGLWPTINSLCCPPAHTGSPGRVSGQGRIQSLTAGGSGLPQAPTLLWIWPWEASEGTGRRADPCRCPPHSLFGAPRGLSGARASLVLPWAPPTGVDAWLLGTWLPAGGLWKG